MSTVSFIRTLNKFAKAGELPSNGICTSITDAEMQIFAHFFPTDEDRHELKKDGLSTVYWGSGMRNGFGEVSAEDFEAYQQESHERRFGLTPLRQTLLIFCAALNNEL